MFPAFPLEKMLLLKIMVSTADSEFTFKVMLPPGALPNVWALMAAPLFRVSVCAVMSIVAGLVEEVPPPVVVKPGLNLPPTVVQIVQMSRILWRPRLTLAAGWPEPITP
jgi:hypothetical protein